MAQSKRWCFTVNNPGAYRPAFSDDMDYMVWQLERGEAGGTEHIQGYVRYKNRKRLEPAKAGILSGTAHMAVAKGSEAQNKEYCMKEATRVEGEIPHEFGDFEPDNGRQGSRTDWTQLKQSMQKGASMTELAETHTDLVCRYPNGIQALQILLGPKPQVQRAVHVMILWGATGTGKTHRLRTTFPDIYEVNPGRDPWGMYAGEKQVMFDEFASTMWPIQEMLRYLDKWKVQLNARYNNKFARWESAFIVSNLDPTLWYTLEDAALQAAFRRRITEVVHVVSQEQVITLVPAIADAGAPGPSNAPAAAIADPAPPAVDTPVAIDSEDEDANPRPLKRRNAGL